MSRLWFESALLPGGWTDHVRLTVVDDCIDRIEMNVTPEEGDEQHAIAVPGLPNIHSHGFQRGLAGLTERRGPSTDSFWTWRELMYQFVERIDPEGLEAITALAFAEMLEAGFTHVVEFHYVHHDREGVPFADPGELCGRVAAAALETGIGLTLLPSFYAHSDFGGAEPTVRQRRFVCDIERFARILESSRKSVASLPGGLVGVAPHSLRAVTPDELTAVVGLTSGEPIHIHVAEQVQEVEACLSWSGQRPVQWLLENAPVDDRWCLVHATHATPEELRGVATSRAVVGLCPLTESSLGDGIFPAVDFLGFGGSVAIGTDSNVRIDAAEELRTLEYSQRLAHRARNVLARGDGASTGRTLFDAALAGGAAAAQLGRSSRADRYTTPNAAFPALRVGRSSRADRYTTPNAAFPALRVGGTRGMSGKPTGSTLPSGSQHHPKRDILRPQEGLEAGALLNLVTLNAQHPSLVDRRGDEILDSWVFAGDRGVVEHVWRAGHQVVSNGHHVRRAAITARYRRALRNLLE
ncbi:MAG TPA: formimidoylglutamate deiminase [Steroidobacteraceae bacterium]